MRFIALVLCAASAATAIASQSRAAGTAYQVDTAETTEPGACKVESWASFASNRDFFGAVNPACGVEFFRQFEFSVQANRARSEGEWSTGLAPKAKMKLVPTAIGTWGWAATATASYDPIGGENTSVAFAIPGTLRVSNVVRININAGVMRDRGLERNFLTYGLGIDVRTPDNVWTVTGEVFGQAGSQVQDNPSLTRPRFQTGLRWRPVDEFSMDFIYGRNITGENANWITVGSTIRFAAR
jgi:hypothetical protein